MEFNVCQNYITLMYNIITTSTNSSHSRQPQTAKKIVDVIKEVAKDPSNLEGYLALNDGIIHQILQCESGAKPEILTVL